MESKEVSNPRNVKCYIYFNKKHKKGVPQFKQEILIKFTCDTGAGGRDCSNVCCQGRIIIELLGGSQGGSCLCQGH